MFEVSVKVQNVTSFVIAIFFQIILTNITLCYSDADAHQDFLN